jgi:hypothetical protein
VPFACPNRILDQFLPGFPYPWQTIAQAK